jgi:hypothetical protein
MEGAQREVVRGTGSAKQHADHRHRRLLRPRPEPPRNRTAEQRDEVAASDGSYHLILPAGAFLLNDSTVVPAFP